MLRPFSLLRPLFAIVRDSVISVVRGLGGGKRLLHDGAARSSGVHTFVMMPLDFALDSAWLSGSELETTLKKLHDAGVYGVMVDVWWGVCEPQVQQYDFERYKQLAAMCKRIGLKMQATFCFHACGGNVGDTVNIPIPEWARKATDARAAWYMDRSQYLQSRELKSWPTGADDVNRECISLGADHLRYLPSIHGIRTPLEAYEGFITAFSSTLHDHMGSTIVELQIGMGPCGELRYPSYPMAKEKWKFPGIGEFTCYDKHMLRDLAESAAKAGHSEWGEPPVDAGTYNDAAWDSKFFGHTYRTTYGQFFLEWYSGMLLKHGDDVLKMARRAAADHNVRLAVKISGVHWWYFSRSRAAEATAGYYMSGKHDFYDKAAALFKKHDAIFEFTCLEMKTIWQPWLAGRCGPRQLVRDVFNTAARHGVMVGGENALESYGMREYRQIIKVLKRSKARVHGFTLLRLTPALLEEGHMENLKQLTAGLREIGA